MGEVLAVGELSLQVQSNTSLLKLSEHIHILSSEWWSVFIMTRINCSFITFLHIIYQFCVYCDKENPLVQRLNIIIFLVHTIRITHVHIQLPEGGADSFVRLSISVYSHLAVQRQRLFTLNQGKVHRYLS